MLPWSLEMLERVLDSLPKTSPMSLLLSGLGGAGRVLTTLAAPSVSASCELAVCEPSAADGLGPEVEGRVVSASE